MPDATITSTASTFGTISGTFAADQSTVTGTITAITGTVDGSVGVPGPQGAQGIQGIQGVPGSPGAPGVGVPAAGTTGQVLQKLSATSYDTGWLTLPADYITSVTAPLAVASGNLSVDLSTYLTSATAASTYYLQTNPSGFIDASALTGYATETFVTTQGYITQGTADGLYYPLSGNPSGFLTSVPPPSLTNLTSDISWDISFSTGRLLISGVNDIGGGNTEARLNFTSAVPNQPATGDFWTNGTDFFYRESGSTKTIASQSYVSATYQTLAGMSSYLTTATAASTYAVIAAGQPTAGTTGQVLTKNSGTNYDSSWATPVVGDRYLTTSTTSNTINNANKTFTIGTGLSYTPTQNITISYNAANHMHGEVLTYNSGTGVLTVDIKNHTGSGTYAAWVVNVGGVTPATSVAWGAITGTISAQSDLQGQLDLKLDVTTAASTYYLQTNPSGFIDATALTPYAPLAGATFTGKVNMAAPTAGSASLNLGVGTAPTTSVAGDIWIASNINFRASDGTLKAVANTNTLNTFSQPQIIQSPLATTTAALRVTQLGTGNAIEVEDSTTPDATRFVVDQFGKVGIGVAPDATAALKLDANGIKFNDGTTQTTAPVAGPTYVNVQVFGGPASSGAFTWNKPTGAKTVEVLMMSGGGGGGSGARQATSAGRFGGGGGGGAGGLYFKIDADALASSETVTVGAGGNGGAAITADTTNGNPGTKGGNSVFGPITCRGGNFGGGGTDTTGAAGATSLWYQWISNVQTVNNRGGVAPAAAPGITHELFACATGGGGGASRNATVTSPSAGGSGGNKLASAGGGVESGLTSAITGGAGGIGGTSTPAVAGTNGTEYWGGTGGGGGGYRPSAVGDSGAAGGWPGGGGGGGGCSDNTFNSGAGAAGGNGVVLIITYCS